MRQLPLLTPDSNWKRPAELPDLRGRPIIATDTETKDDGLASGRGAGWAYRSGHIIGLSMAAEDIAVYAPIRHPEGDCFEPDQVERWYNDHVKSGVRMVFHNAGYDLGWTGTEWGSPPPENLEDSMAMAYILDENRLTYNLDDVSKWRGVAGKDETLLKEAAHCYGVSPKAGLHLLPARYVGPYAEQDCRASLSCALNMLPLIKEQDLEAAYRLEVDLIPMAVEMRRRGIKIDTKAAVKLRAKFKDIREQALSDLGHKLGRSVEFKQINSNAFLTKLFDEQQIPYPRTPGTSKFPQGQPSFEADWMSKREHWLPKLVLRARKYQDAGEKFIGNYIQGFTHMGRIHAEIHTHKDDAGGTVTSRLSYSDPPLQQMPSRDPEIGPLIRELFLPEDGEYWYAPDYSQQEYRLIVHFANVCGIAGVGEAVRIYNEDPDADFHNIVVELTGLIRRDAKDANFAKAFGAGVGKFALMIDKSMEDAARIYSIYDDKLPFVKRMAEFCQGRADKRGYLRLIDGMRAHFDSWEPRWRPKGEMYVAPMGLEAARLQWPDRPLRRAFTHKAMNRLIQGSAARQTKLAMREAWRAKLVPLIQMHDELDFSMGSEADGLRVMEMMRDIIKLTVPVKVDPDYGINWGRAKYDWQTVSKDASVWWRQ